MITHPLPWGWPGTAALIKDLKQRGLLEDTIIHWTTEFGRMPSSQGSTAGSQPFVFTNWLAGAVSGWGDPRGKRPVGLQALGSKNPTQVYDVYATMLHQLGLDHERLIRHNSIDGADRRARSLDQGNHQLSLELSVGLPLGMDCPKVFFLFAESESIGLNIGMFLRPLLLSVSLLSYGSLLAEDLSFTKTSDLCCRMPASIVMARIRKLVKQSSVSTTGRPPSRLASLRMGK